jgi:hypothetical protein
VTVLTPVLGAVATASCPCSRSWLRSFDPMSPVPPTTTIFMIISFVLFDSLHAVVGVFGRTLIYRALLPVRDFLRGFFSLLGLETPQPALAGTAFCWHRSLRLIVGRLSSYRLRFSAAQPFTFHLPLKNSINPLNKRAIRRDELAVTHSQALASVPTTSEADRLFFNQRSSAPQEPSPPLPVLGTFTVYRTSWKDMVDSGFEKLSCMCPISLHTTFITTDAETGNNWTMVSAIVWYRSTPH